jgi:epoxyqueuosine reductase
MYTRINTLLSESLDPEVYAYGIAKLEGLIPQYSWGISILRRLSDEVIDGIKDGPTHAYLGLYNEVNAELNDLVAGLSRKLSAIQVENKPVKATVSEGELDEEYSRTLTYAVSHKMIATRAGLGWIGKTDLLVSHRFGPRVRLASILFNAPLDYEPEPTEESLCGDCGVCVSVCPARAATGESWRAGIHRDSFFNAFLCQDYCRKISREKIGKNVTICGKCVSLCPKGKKAKA